MIELRAVSKHYAGKCVLQPSDLRIEAGKTTVLIGPSGSGKTTLLRLMIGLVEPTSGSVQVDGQALSKGNLMQLRRRMGYVIQGGGLFPHWTGRQNVVFMARRMGWTASQIDTQVEDLRQLCQLEEDALCRFPAQLSGGQCQRVSLMRALMLKPDILLMDEPLGALDPMIRHGLQEELAAIFARLAKTVVLVTHDMAEAAFFADTIVLMNQGAVVQSGSSDELLNEPAEPFVERFVQAQRASSLRDS